MDIIVIGSLVFCKTNLKNKKINFHNIEYIKKSHAKIIYLYYLLFFL